MSTTTREDVILRKLIKYLKKSSNIPIGDSDREKICSFIGTNRDDGNPQQFSEIPDEIVNEILGFYVNVDGTNKTHAMTISQYYSLRSVSKEWKTKLETVEFIQSMWWEIDIPSLLKTIETHGISESLQKILENATHVEVQNFITDQTLYDAKQKFISKKYGFDKDIIPTIEILDKSGTGKVVFPSCIHFCIRSTKQKQIQSVDMYQFLVNPGLTFTKDSSVPMSNADQFGYVNGESVKGLYMHVDVIFRDYMITLVHWAALERLYIHCPKLYNTIYIPNTCHHVAMIGDVTIRIPNNSDSKIILLQNGAGLSDYRTRTDIKSIVFAMNQQWNGDTADIPSIALKIVDTVICDGGPVIIETPDYGYNTNKVPIIENLVLVEAHDSTSIYPSLKIHGNTDIGKTFPSLKIHGNPYIGNVYFKNKELREKETNENSVLLRAKIIKDTIPTKYTDLVQKFKGALLDYRKFSILE